MVEIAPGEDVQDIVGEDLGGVFLVAQDIEGVLVANGAAYTDYYERYMRERDVDMPAAVAEPGLAGVIDHFTGLHDAYRPDHLFGDLGSDGTLADQFPDLADTPYSDLEPFHPAVDRFWREDAAAVKNGGERRHLAPTDPDVPASLESFRTEIREKTESHRFYLVTGRPRVEQEMKTVIADIGVEENVHYDGFFVVDDAGPEDKLDKSFHLYVDDSPDRAHGATGDDIVFVHDHPRNDALEGYDRDLTTGIRRMAEARLAVDRMPDYAFSP